MKKRVFAYLHTHWDREWYRDKEDFNLRFLDVFDIVLSELKNNKAPFFYLDGQIIALLDYLKYREEKLPEILELIKNKKLSIGPYFVSADSYLVNFRCMLKNLELGIKYSKKFNETEFIGYLSDIFGVSNSVFEALKINNIDKAIIWRGVNPLKIDNNCNFIKNGIKTVYLAQGYFNDFVHSENIDALEKHLDKIAEYSIDNLLLPIGADHLGMLQDASSKISKINKQLKNYEIILTSPFEYFKNNKFKNISAPQEFLDNSNTYILQSVYSSRINQKIKNAKLQNKISRIVEILDYYLENKYSKNIDMAYEELIKNHAHDSIYGCSTDDVHDTVSARQNKCENMLNAILKRIIGDFQNKYEINSNSTESVGLFNLSNFDNLKVVKVEAPYILKNAQVLSEKRAFPDRLLKDIYKIPVTEQIETIYTQLIEVDNNKKFSFKNVKIKKPKKIVKINSNSIKNEKIELFVKNNKVFVTNEKNKFELCLTDIKDMGDSYNYAPYGEYKKLELINTKVLYDGEIESCLELNYKDIKLFAYLNNTSDYVRFKADINNKKKNHKLQLNLVLKDKIKEILSDDPIKTIVREVNSNYNIQDYMPVSDKSELKTNLYPIQNFVSANNLTIITCGLNECEIYKNELKICLLRTFNTISNPKNPTRKIPAGPNLPCVKSELLGHNEAEFVIFFNDSKYIKQIFRNLDEFNETYVVLDGEYCKKTNFKEENINDELYIYGVSEGRKIAYNMKNGVVSMI